MSSSYPKLNDRHIDQWKVTELKEELRSRGLKLGGNKEELVKRLASALEEVEGEENTDAASAQEEVEGEENTDAASMLEEAESEENTDAGINPDNNFEAAKVDGDESVPAHEADSVEPVEADKVHVEHLATEVVENSAEPVLVSIEQSALTVFENSAETDKADIVVLHVEDEADKKENDVIMADNIDQEKKEKHETSFDTKNGSDIDIHISLEQDTTDVTDVKNEDSKLSSEDEKNENVPESQVSVEQNSETEARNNDTMSSAEDAMNDNPDQRNQVSAEDAMKVNPDQLNQVSTEDAMNDNPDQPNQVSAKDAMNDNPDQLNQVSAEDAMNDNPDQLNQVSAEGAMNDNPDQLNQVSAEVSPDFGLQVKSESITTTTTTDNVSINVKNELKDNLNANNVNLELEVVKLEMVQPSFSEVTYGLDVEPSKKIEDVEEGSPEKLNLDRSSGDEFMQDVVENKQIKSNNSFEKEEDVEKPIDALVSGFSPENKDLNFEEEAKPTGMTEKRKAEEHDEPKRNNEPKRQRRWNVDTTKVSDSQTSNLTVNTVNTPKAVFQPTLRKSFNRSNSSLSGDATPKERHVPPSLKPATISLRIDRFLRPFTLKAVQELLAKTGTVCDFWMDQIKTHCYVTYSSVEEAIATRDALYNLQWPTNGGRQLTAEFVDAQEVKNHLEAPPRSPAPITPATSAQTALPFQRQPPGPPASARKPPHQQLPPPPPGPPPAAAKEILPPPPPLLPKEPEPPIITLDDLFRKTKTTPRIYYLPLSDEQVAAKRAEQGKRARNM